MELSKIPLKNKEAFDLDSDKFVSMIMKPGSTQGTFKLFLTSLYYGNDPTGQYVFKGKESGIVWKINIFVTSGISFLGLGGNYKRLLALKATKEVSIHSEFMDIPCQKDLDSIVIFDKFIEEKV